MDSCDSVGRSKICDVRRCKKRMWLSVSLTAIFYIVVHLYTSHQRILCNHNEAMYFYAISGEKEVSMRKVLIPKKRLCKRTDKDHPCYKR